MSKASCWKGILGVQRNSPETLLKVKLCLFHPHPIQEPSLHIPAEVHCHPGQAGCGILQRTVLEAGVCELSSGASRQNVKPWLPFFLAGRPGQVQGLWARRLLWTGTAWLVSWGSSAILSTVFGTRNGSVIKWLVRNRRLCTAVSETGRQNFPSVKSWLTKPGLGTWGPRCITFPFHTCHFLTGPAFLCVTQGVSASLQGGVSGGNTEKGLGIL